MLFFINKSKKSRLFILFVITIAVLLISGCAEEDAWFAAKQADTIESYEEYIENYPEGEYVEEAEELIEELVWQMASNEDVIESYEEYLEEYPDGEYIEEANKALEFATFRAVKEENTIESYEFFLDEYPESEYAEEALEALKEVTPKLARIKLDTSASTWREGEEPYDIENEVKRMLENLHFEITSENYDARLEINYTENKSMRWRGDIYGTKITCAFMLYEKDDLLLEEIVKANTSYPVIHSHRSKLYDAVYYDALNKFKSSFYFKYIGDIIATKFGGTICGLEDELSVVISALGDEDEVVCRQAANLLFDNSDARVVEPLIDILNYEYKFVRTSSWARVRERAARELGNIGDTRAVEPLIGVLDDENNDVRKNAAEALGEIGDTRAIEPLKDLLDDEVERVRENAAEALEKINQ